MADYKSTVEYLYLADIEKELEENITKDFGQRHNRIKKVIIPNSGLARGIVTHEADTGPLSGSTRDANQILKNIEALSDRIATAENLKNSFIFWAVSESSRADVIQTEETAGVIYTTYFKDNYSWWQTGYEQFNIDELLGDIAPQNVLISQRYEQPTDKTTIDYKGLVPFWRGFGERLLADFESGTDMAKQLDNLEAPPNATEEQKQRLAEKRKALYAQGAQAALSDPKFGENLPEDVQDQKVNWWARHKQCVLLSGLEKLYPISEGIRKSLKGDGYHPYRGRVVPINSSNPEMLINDMIIPPYTNVYLGPAMLKDWYTWVKPTYKISYIQSVDDGFLEKKVFPILSDQKSYSSCADKSITDMTILNKSKFDAASNIIFESFTYTMNGSDPATSRKDISAKLKIKLTNLEYINKPFQVPAIDPKGKETTEIMKIVDLLLYPSDLGKSKGPGKVYTNQYHPSYNRLQVSITNRIVNEDLALSSLVQTKKLDKAKKHLELLKKIFKEGAMILNLALVDHAFAINKTKDDFSISLTIDYAGYFETALGAPYVDGLAGTELIEKRQKREDELVELVKNGKCSVTDVDKISANFERLAAAEAKTARQGIMNRMIRRMKIHKVVFDQAAIREYALASATTPNDPDKIWQAANIAEFPIGVNEEELSTGAVDAQKKDIEASTTNAPTKIKDIQNIKTTNEENLYYFFLGDLLEVVTDCMYQSVGKDDLFSKSRDANSKTLEKMKLYLATANFTYRKSIEKATASNTDAETSAQLKALGLAEATASTPAGEKIHNINICDVPISVDFFKAWFNETVIKKRRTYYPAMAMIRDLVERVITNLLNEVCFSGGGSAGKVLFKVTTGASLSDNGSDYLYDKYLQTREANLSLDRLSAKDLPLLRKDVDRPAKDYMNYLMIYTQEQSMYDSTIDTKGSHRAHLRKNIPHLNVGHNQDGSVISAGYTKTDIPFHREARYFQGGGGSLMQLANVYQAKGVSLQHNTFMHNGMMIWMEFIDLNNCGGTSAVPGSIANQLGLGGYHIVTKTEGTVKPNGSGDTKIDASWVFSGVRRSIRPDQGSAPSITSNEKCSELLESSAQEADRAEAELPAEGITKEANPAKMEFGEGEELSYGDAVLNAVVGPGVGGVLPSS